MGGCLSSLVTMASIRLESSSYFNVFSLLVAAPGVAPDFLSLVVRSGTLSLRNAPRGAALMRVRITPWHQRGPGHPLAFSGCNVSIASLACLIDRSFNPQPNVVAIHSFRSPS